VEEVHQEVEEVHQEAENLYHQIVLKEEQIEILIGEKP
jgi:hypothetical protein